MKTTRLTVPGATLLCVALIAPGIGPDPGERDGGQVHAITALRAIVSAEIAYASANGYYDELACLTTTSCIPGRRAGRQAFLDPALAAAKEWRGYRLEFHAGPQYSVARPFQGRDRRAESPAPQESNVPVSRSAMARFAVVAFAATDRGVRHRAFCADDRQTIYVTTAVAAPRVRDGHCLDAGHPIGGDWR